ncbi:type IV pilin [Halorhabdus sp. CBA1104]|nr:type IV pilin [Halorhabdus sp. CBA1104]
MHGISSDEKRGVISVLGILLMLFGAIAGSFVIGMGDTQQRGTAPPQVQFEFESDETGAVTITHTGGDMVPRSEVEIQSPGSAGEWTTSGSDGEIAAGDEITVTGLERGDTVRIVWESPESDASAVLATYDVP